MGRGLGPVVPVPTDEGAAQTRAKLQEARAKIEKAEEEAVAEKKEDAVAEGKEKLQAEMDAKRKKDAEAKDKADAEEERRSWIRAKFDAEAQAKAALPMSPIETWLPELSPDPRQVRPAAEPAHAWPGTTPAWNRSTWGKAEPKQFTIWGQPPWSPDTATSKPSPPVQPQPKTTAPPSAGPADPMEAAHLRLKLMIEEQTQQMEALKWEVEDLRSKQKAGEGVDDNAAGGGDDDPIMALAGQLAKKRDGTGFRIGNVVQKIPKLPEKSKWVSERLYQLAEFVRTTRRYMLGTLLTDSAIGLFDKLITTTSELHKAYLSLDEDDQDQFRVSDHVLVPELDDDERKYFRIFPGLLYDHMPETVKTELIFLEDKKAAGWIDLVAMFLSIRRLYDVNTTSQLEELENLARRARGLDADGLRKWWIASAAAVTLGHISASQIARGLVRLIDRWEQIGVLTPREQRDLSALISLHKLDKFEVSDEAIDKVIKRMCRLVQNTTAKVPAAAVKAYAAEEIGQLDTQESPIAPPTTTEEDPAALAAMQGKGGKSTGKGGKGGNDKGKDGGCFNCGSKDHWLRQCPKPRANHVAVELWNDERALAAVGDAGALNQERTAQGLCWTCGSAEHTKKQCPKWLERQRANAARPKAKAKSKSQRARLAAVLAEFLCDDNDPGNQVNTVPPTPPD